MQELAGNGQAGAPAAIHSIPDHRVAGEACCSLQDRGPCIKARHGLASGIGPGPQGLGEARSDLGWCIAGSDPVDDRPARLLRPMQDQGRLAHPPPVVDQEESSCSLGQDLAQLFQLALAAAGFVRSTPLPKLLGITCLDNCRGWEVGQIVSGSHLAVRHPMLDDA